MTGHLADLPQVATIEETASLLGVSRWTLTAWRQRGTQPGLRFVVLNGRVRYNRADVMWLRFQRRRDAERGLADAAPTEVRT